MTNDNTPISNHDFLTWWRTKSLGDLAPAHGTAKKLIGHLGPMTETTTDRMEELLAEAMDEISTSAFDLGCLLMGKDQYGIDLAMSWVLVAALFDNAAGQLFVAHELVRSTSDDFYLFDNWGCPIDENETTHKLTAKDIQKLRIAREWALQIPPIHRYRKYMSRELATEHQTPQSSTSFLEQRRHKRQREEALSGTPSLRVVNKITPGTNAETKDMVKSYECLEKQLPLIGNRISPDVFANTLDDEFPWFSDVTSRVAGDLRLMQICGSPWFHFRPILFLGPAGVGKTRYASKLAKLAGVGFGVVNAAGSSDNRMLAGTARGWHGTQPAYPLQVIRRSECANPIIVVDEVDKAGGSSRNGFLHDTLLSMMEAETASDWHDEALLAPANLSQISWILTANDIRWLPRPLLSRIKVIEVGQPTEDAFDNIIANVRFDLARELGTQPEALPSLAPVAERMLAQAFASGCSIRKLKAAYVSAIAQAPEPSRTLH